MVNDVECANCCSSRTVYASTAGVLISGCTVEGEMLDVPVVGAATVVLL